MSEAEEKVNLNETFSYYIFGCNEEIHSDYTFFQETINYIIDANEDNSYDRIKSFFCQKMKYVIDHDIPTNTEPRVYTWHVTLLNVNSSGKIMNGLLQFSFSFNYNQERTMEDHKLKIKDEIVYYNWPGDEIINNIRETPEFKPLTHKKMYLVYLSAGDVCLNKYICRGLEEARECYNLKNLMIASWYSIPAKKFMIYKLELNNLETHTNKIVFEMDIKISGISDT